MMPDGGRAAQGGRATGINVWSRGARGAPGGSCALFYAGRGTRMDNIWMALYWTGPIGVGAFLAGLGVLFWGISKIAGKRA